MITAADRELILNGLAGIYGNPEIEPRGIEHASIVEYHGSIEEFHGRAALIGDCKCVAGGCLDLFNDDYLSPDRRAILAVPHYGQGVQLLLHTRWTSITTSPKAATR